MGRHEPYRKPILRQLANHNNKNDSSPIMTVKATVCQFNKGVIFAKLT